MALHLHNCINTLRNFPSLIRKHCRNLQGDFLFWCRPGFNWTPFLTDEAKSKNWPWQSSPFMPPAMVFDDFFIRWYLLCFRLFFSLCWVLFPNRPLQIDSFISLEALSGVRYQCLFQTDSWLWIVGKTFCFPQDIKVHTRTLSQNNWTVHSSS